MRQQRHRLLLDPFVRSRIVFVGHADRLPSGREAAEDIHLASRRGAQQLFGGLGKEGELDPFALGVCSRRQKQAEPYGDETNAKRTDGTHHLLPLASMIDDLQGMRKLHPGRCLARDEEAFRERGRRTAVDEPGRISAASLPKT